MEGVIVGFILMIAGIIVPPIVHPWLEAQRKKRARIRLEDDPLFNVGAVISRLELPGHPQPLLVDCQITKLGDGYVELEDGEGYKMSLSCREFEALHPIFEPGTGEPYYDTATQAPPRVRAPARKKQPARRKRR